MFLCALEGVSRTSPGNDPVAAFPFQKTIDMGGLGVGGKEQVPGLYFIILLTLTLRQWQLQEYMGGEDS